MVFSPLSRCTFLGFPLDRPQTWRWLSRIVLSIGTVSLFAAPAAAFPSFNLLNRHDYRRCAEGLRDAGITAQLSAEACAGTIRPRDLSQCVNRIRNVAAISSEEALVGCLSVRRPQELGTCVTGIVQVAGSADPLNVLNGCVSSLLPERYSFCVIGLAEVHRDIPVNDLLETCLHPSEKFTDLNLGF